MDQTESADVPSVMKWRAKIVKQGTTMSLTITRPAKALGLKLGDYVDVTLERIKD